MGAFSIVCDIFLIRLSGFKENVEYLALVLLLLFCFMCTHFILFNRDGSELSTRDLQKVVQALPQYSEKIEKLSLHVEVGFFPNVFLFSRISLMF